VTRFVGGDPHGEQLLGYEETLNALLTLIGRRVLVLFSGTSGNPFIAGVLSGRMAARFGSRWRYGRTRPRSCGTTGPYRMSWYSAPRSRASPCTCGTC